MTGEMLHLDFREGSSYRMRLTSAEPQQGRGKTSEDSDETEVRIMKLEKEHNIEQEIISESEEKVYSPVFETDLLDMLSMGRIQPAHVTINSLRIQIKKMIAPR